MSLPPVPWKGPPSLSCSYLKTRPVGLQRLEDWHGPDPLVHLHPTGTSHRSGCNSNGCVIFCRRSKTRTCQRWGHRRQALATEGWIQTFERPSGDPALKVDKDAKIDEGMWILESNFQVQVSAPALLLASCDPGSKFSPLKLQFLVFDLIKNIFIGV